MSEEKNKESRRSKNQLTHLPFKSGEETRNERVEMRNSKMKRMTGVLVFSLILVFSADATAQGFTSGDLKIYSDGDGSVGSVTIDDRSLPVGDQLGGVFIREMTNANVPVYTLFEEGFENADHDWEFHHNTGNAKIDWITMDAASFEGGRCLLVQMHDGATSAQKGRILSSMDKLIPVMGGQRYRLQCVYKATRGYLSANPGSLKMQYGMYDPMEGFYTNGVGVSWLDANGRPVGEHCLAAPFMDQAVEWKNVGGMVTCPNGAVYARVTLGANFDDEYPEEGYLVDAIRMFEDQTTLEQVQGNFTGAGWDQATFNGVMGPFDLKLNCDAVEEGILFTGTVEALDGNSHAFDLVISLPVDAEGWTWADDVGTSRSISADEADWYAAEVSADGQSSLPISIYPYGGIHDAESGLAACLPLDPTHMASIGYNAKRKTFDIEYRLAVAPALGHASVSFCGGFYAYNPKHGFRGIIDKYRRFWSDKTDWFTSEYDPSQYRDLYRGSVRGQGGARKVKDHDDSGTFSCLYLCPDFIVDEIGKAGKDIPPTMDEIMTLIGQRVNSADPIESYYYTHVIGETMKAPNGDMVLKYCDDTRSTGGWIQAVFKITPSIDQNGDGYLSFVRDNFLAPAFDCTMNPDPKWGCDPSILDGVLLDNFCNQTSFDNDPDHIASSTWGLTYSPNDYSAALSPVTGAQEIVKWLRNWLDNNVPAPKRNVVPNWWGVGHTNGIVPWCDYLLDEVNGAIENGEYGHGRTGNFDPFILRYKRALAYGKYRGQKFNGKDIDQDDVLDTFHTYLLYGMGATPDTSLEFENPSVFGYDQCIEFADAHNAFVAVVHNAGWEPLTMASCSTPDILLERYGSPDDGVFYLAAFNDGSGYASGTIELSKNLGLTLQPLDVYEEVTGQSYPLGGSSPSWTIDFSDLRKRRILVFRVTVDPVSGGGPGYPKLLPGTGNRFVVSNNNQGTAGGVGSSPKMSSTGGKSGGGSGPKTVSGPEPVKKTKTRAQILADRRAAAKAKAAAKAQARVEARAKAKADREAKAQARAEALALAKAERQAKVAARAEARALARAEAKARAQARREARALRLWGRK